MFFFAWAVGEGIIVWRFIKHKAPPTPGALLLPSGLYVALGVIATYQPARFTATAFAWALDAAILLQIVGKDPGIKTGWPPPKIPATQIWPGAMVKTASSPSPAAGGTGPAVSVPPTGVQTL